MQIKTERVHKKDSCMHHVLLITMLIRIRRFIKHLKASKWWPHLPFDFFLSTSRWGATQMGGGEDRHGEGTHTSWCGSSLSPPRQNPKGPSLTPLPLTPYIHSGQLTYCLSNPSTYHPQCRHHFLPALFQQIIKFLLLLKCNYKKYIQTKSSWQA